MKFNESQLRQVKFEAVKEKCMINSSRFEVVNCRKCANVRVITQLHVLTATGSVIARLFVR